MDVGTFTAHPELVDLPPLVRRQRTLEAQIVPFGPLLQEEKTVRQAIDGLLIAAGLIPGSHVTCNGYDVTHIERAGTSRLNEAVLTAQLIAAGLEGPTVRQILAEATETGEPSSWALVKPSKGSKVRK